MAIHTNVNASSPCFPVIENENENSNDFLPENSLWPAYCATEKKFPAHSASAITRIFFISTLSFLIRPIGYDSCHSSAYQVSDRWVWQMRQRFCQGPELCFDVFTYVLMFEWDRSGLCLSGGENTESSHVMWLVSVVTSRFVWSWSDECRCT